jgi:uroporphyrinogen decarboxylase
MTPKQATILALEGKQPEFVPHFELEMQLVREYFDDEYTSWDAWKTYPERREQFMRHDMELLVRTADHFGYGAIFYSLPCCRWDKDFCFEGMNILRDLNGGKYLLATHGDTTLAIPDGQTMDEQIVNILMNMDSVKDEQRRKVDEGLEEAHRWKAAGLDVFALCSDYCFNSGPFLSPAMFSDLVTPCLQALVRGYRDMGFYTIKHTDGNIMPILDDLISAGPHALHSLDPMAGVDIKEIKRITAGKMCLIGNVNCALMQTGTDEQVLESCRYAMENGKPGGGYIFSTSNIIFKGMPKERYELMLGYYRENRGY